MTDGMTGSDNYVSRPDGRIYYHKVGEGEPVIFMHSSGGSGWTWRHVIPIVAEHFTCLNIDLPGFDHSDIPPRQYSIEDYARAIVDVLDGAGLQKTHIIGDHTGSHIALALAANFPDRVNRMVLDGLPYWNKERGRIVWERSMVPGFTDTTSYDVPVSPLTTWEAALNRNPNQDRESWERSEAIKKKSRLWMRYTEEANTQFEGELAGPKVKAPTLLVFGEKDALRRGEARAHDGIKGSFHKVFPGVAGTAHGSKPEEFARLAVDFLSDREIEP
jgi:pimeloyl-ACP methyl ester carboxylesterase